MIVAFPNGPNLLSVYEAAENLSSVGEIQGKVELKSPYIVPPARSVISYSSFS